LAAAEKSDDAIESARRVDDPTTIVPELIKVIELSVTVPPEVTVAVNPPVPDIPVSTIFVALPCRNSWLLVAEPVWIKSNAYVFAVALHGN
jgi:hypothetical protein